MLVVSAVARRIIGESKASDTVLLKNSYVGSKLISIEQQMDIKDAIEVELKQAKSKGPVFVSAGCVFGRLWRISAAKS